VGGAQRPKDLPYPTLADPDDTGEVGGGQLLTALHLPQPPQLFDALGASEGAAPQRGEGAAHVVLAHPDLPRHGGRVEWLAAGDLAGLVELLDALQRPSRRLTLLELGAAAAGVGGLQGLELLGSWVAVADRLGAQVGQASVGLVAGAEGVEPLAGDRGGGADLPGEGGRVELLTAL
jgi:hypothetical protein